MNRNIFVASFAAILVLTAACNRSANQKVQLIAERYISDSGSVAFDIGPIRNEAGNSQLVATYTSDGKTARFRLEFGPERTVEVKDADDFSFSAGEGRFVAEPLSDASVLMADLKKALEATVVPTKVQRSASLPFTFVTIGEHLSQAERGGFNTRPSGNWKAMKLFIGEGEQEAEVFLNLNPVIGKGQFSIKDPDYGNAVLAELAKVL